jgi:hypothetical protein
MVKIRSHFQQPRLLFPNVPCLPLPDGVVVFASGMNRVADLRGAEAAGVPIGVDVSKLSENAINTLMTTQLPVLLDSGAFGEVSFRNGKVGVISEIGDREWVRRLAIYLRVTKPLRNMGNGIRAFPQVSAIAPDRVGSQELTFVRLRTFRAEVANVQSAGADILVPLQAGRLNLCDFYHKARHALGIDIVPSMPMKKAATTVESVIQFIQQVRPGRIHLLGMGANHRHADRVIRLIRYAFPEIRISMDSNRVRAAVGARRTITQKEEHYRDELTSDWTEETDLRAWGGDIHDMTEELFQPSTWLSDVRLREVADSLSWLTQEQRGVFLSHPDAFVSDEANQCDWLHETLMQAYFRRIRREARTSARTRAVAEVLTESKIGGQAETSKLARIRQTAL